MLSTVALGYKTEELLSVEAIPDEAVWTPPLLLWRREEAVVSFELARDQCRVEFQPLPCVAALMGHNWAVWQPPSRAALHISGYQSVWFFHVSWWWFRLLTNPVFGFSLPLTSLLTEICSKILLFEDAPGNSNEKIRVVILWFSSCPTAHQFSNRYPPKKTFL